MHHLDQVADELGIDRENIFLSGGSAGGHLAVSAVLFHHAKNNLYIKGLVLFNPVLDTSSKGYQSLALTSQEWNPLLFSPLHYLYAVKNESVCLPPTIIFHGTSDTVMPYERVWLFYEEVCRQKQKIFLFGYEGQQHGFFNQQKSKDDFCYFDTLDRSLAFCGDVLRNTLADSFCSLIGCSTQ